MSGREGGGHGGGGEEGGKPQFRRVCKERAPSSEIPNIEVVACTKIEFREERDNHWEAKAVEGNCVKRLADGHEENVPLAHLFLTASP